ncbi:acetoacetate metabolism regulatory protein AtoC [Desulfoluna limicola]|uniref:Acetoacetate metabolism regulatory protein AtoC n=1 Tax=Desulfoluna limicola TaxID=2810562 RepID=A0ABM7PG88_9BACT|nr:sigma-54 dependent transcriptional regulator [Desulfoluna limicola]BCS96090.1 acetoacetate metabolism regulatory protein AtoC [Desulfoluna limicola]
MAVKMQRVLVVDDEAHVRILLTEILKMEGFFCYQAANGKEALAFMDEAPADLVLMDIRMPVMSGMDAFRIMRDKWPEVPVIMTTAFAGVDTAVEAMKLGAYNYISKPFNNAEIILTVKRGLEIQSLTREVETLRKVVRTRYSINNIIGKSAGMQEVFKSIGRVAPTNTTVLIQGESGTGKELVAKAIHYNSIRSQGPMVNLNCAAIPEGLLESELFGHEKGSFTGAVNRQKGKFELAAGGTIFLDEISEMSPNLQAKLLRVLQDREFQRVGGMQPILADVRVIAASNKDLSESIREGRFREDLYYRLNVVQISIPPLRERREDIPLLVDHFISRCNEETGKQVQQVSEDAFSQLSGYAWPGNVRELENAVERAVVMGQGGVIMSEDLPVSLQGLNAGAAIPALDIKGGSLKEMMEGVEADILKNALDETGWNRVKTAEKLKMSRKALIYKIEKYGLTPS